MRHTRLIAGLALGTMLTAPAMAQDNMERLGNMQKTDATFTFIPQDIRNTCFKKNMNTQVLLDKKIKDLFPSLAGICRVFISYKKNIYGG